MALTIVKRFFSETTDGFPKEVATTSTNCANFHIGSTATNVMEELYMYAMVSTNATNTGLNTLTVLINSNCYTVDVPAKAIDYPILSGFPLWGRSASGTVVHVYGSSTAGVFVYGYLNRITET